MKNVQRKFLRLHVASNFAAEIFSAERVKAIKTFFGGVIMFW